MSYVPASTRPARLATELYAISQGSFCEGEYMCHWCGAPCKRLWMHDEVPLTTIGHGVRYKTHAIHPGNPYICAGCWLWRRKRITATFLDGTYKDSQAPVNHSWWITQDGAWSLSRDSSLLYEFLLEPPTRFVLALVTEGAENRLQHAVLTSKPEILADTPLEFTVNCTPYFYTVYELTEAIGTGEVEGKSPGVAALFSALGKPPESLVNREKEIREDRLKKEEWQEKRGRPQPIEDGRVTKRKIR